jgi:8-oxo-dGTP pyrophosphatase MutT (NUDIX family)
MMSRADTLLRPIMIAGHQLLKAGWFIRRPRTFGAHAFALTPERKLILVKLRYASGWRLPGGGHGSGEDPREAALRELREEIGLVSHGRIRLACELEQSVHFKQDLASLLIVEDVRYRPRWSWEVERIIEASLDDLPNDLAQITRKWIEIVSASL